MVNGGWFVHTARIGTVTNKSSGLSSARGRMVQYHPHLVYSGLVCYTTCISPWPRRVSTHAAAGAVGAEPGANNLLRRSARTSPLHP